MFNVAEVTRSFDVPYAYGVVHIGFENEVPVGLLSGLDGTQPEDMLVALQRIKNCGNSKVECVVKHHQDVLDANPLLKELSERGSFTETKDIDSYIASLKNGMDVH